VDAIAVAWFVGKLYALFTNGATVTTDELLADQVNGPTVGVTSAPWLKACASTVMVLPWVRQGSWIGRLSSRTPTTLMLSIGG
jgi:hypothetical protein